MNAKARLPSDNAIPVRRLGLRPGKHIAKHFHGGDPFLSAFFAAMSSVFPDGERFFIDSVRHYQKALKDPELIAQVKGFIGQEAHHGQEHEAFNDWLQEKGYPISDTLERVRNGLTLARQRLKPRQQLAMTLALEHFTAIMAHQFLSMPELSEQMDPELRELFMWHAVEETEHKAVAFDVYQQVDGGYWNRVLMMVEITLLFWLAMSRITWRYLKADGTASLKRVAGGIAWLLGNPGPLRKLVPDYLAYFRPGFHPWDQDNRELIRPLQERMASYLLQT